MSRIRALPLAEVDSRARDCLAAVTAGFGETPNMAMVMAQSRAVLAGYARMAGALAGGRLSLPLQRPIEIGAAQANRCAYSPAAHMAIGRNAGLGDEELEANRRVTPGDPRTAAAEGSAS
jgi:AhpD family alkylhydroperoxidase